MANVKGTDVLTIRRLLAEAGPEVEARVLAKVSSDVVGAYRRTVASTWTAVELQAAFYEAAADALFPGQHDPVELLFIEVARRSYSNVYRFFLSIPSIPFLVAQAARLWRTYYDTGTASAEFVAKGKARFKVSHFSALPRVLRSAITGHIRFLVENTGAKAVSIAVDESNPVHWIWEISYR
jgi:hypothetical protein